MDGRERRGVQTRARIVEVATALFVRDGYDRTSIEDVLRDTGMSRGALYHHFTGKAELFAAVLETIEERISVAVAQAAVREAPAPAAMLKAGCAAFLQLAATDAAVRRIVLTDALAAVGWAAWRAMDERYALGMLRATLQMAAQGGTIDAGDVDVYAHVLLAATIEAALLVSAAKEPAPVLERSIAAVGRTIDALLS